LPNGIDHATYSNAIKGHFNTKSKNAKPDTAKASGAANPAATGASAGRLQNAMRRLLADRSPQELNTLIAAR
jgi:hypothetical protein